MTRHRMAFHRKAPRSKRYQTTTNHTQHRTTLSIFHGLAGQKKKPCEEERNVFFFFSKKIKKRKNEKHDTEENIHSPHANRQEEMRVTEREEKRREREERERERERERELEREDTGQQRAQNNLILKRRHTTLTRRISGEM